MSRERALLARVAFETVHNNGITEKLYGEIEAYLAEPAQEPEPVAWMWQSDNYATRFSQRIFEPFDEADDMRNRHGGNLYPLYFEASPNAKRIAELESRINNGVRVYAHQDRIDGFTAATNRDISYSGKMKANATLLLDEQGD